MQRNGLQALGNPLRWTVDTTSDNTAGDGINSFCQAARFADPQGLRTYVRTFQFASPAFVSAVPRCSPAAHNARITLP